MSIPNSVKVAGIEYKVVEKDYVEIDNNRNYAGAACYSDTTIELLKELGDTRKEQTFIHELVHTIFYEAGFREQDEDMVNRLGIVLHQVLKDNHLYFGKENALWAIGQGLPCESPVGIGLPPSEGRDE